MQKYGPKIFFIIKNQSQAEKTNLAEITSALKTTLKIGEASPIFGIRADITPESSSPNEINFDNIPSVLSTPEKSKDRGSPQSIRSPDSVSSGISRGRGRPLLTENKIEKSNENRIFDPTKNKKKIQKSAGRGYNHYGDK